MKNILAPMLSLARYGSEQDYRGWDPYDGLNSRVFKALPWVGRSATARLVWIQLFKRNPLNLRRMLLVPKQHNAKGIALFLQGSCEEYRAWQNIEAYSMQSNPQNPAVKPPDSVLERINYLGGLLLKLRTPGFSGAAWGYNFPWQCRREFLFPAGEPTVVATNFAAWALLDAADITGRKDFRDVALSAADFIINDLRRTPHKGGVIISYSKMPGNDTIYNASLLGARLLARIGKQTGRQDCLDLAQQSMEACCAEQRPDGSWTYGLKPVTGWIDSFHTGYNLEAIQAYAELTGDQRFAQHLERGLDYYLRTFFLDDGTPRYYHNKTYPIDIHCPGQLLMTLARTHHYSQHHELVHRVLEWTNRNMRSPKGYYYYQKKKGISSHIPYMRWSNAFMYCALATAFRCESDLALITESKKN